MKVYALDIQHRHGSGISVHRTKADAEKAIDEYVLDNWEHEIQRSGQDTEPMPADPDARCRAYFEIMEDESADIEECELEGGDELLEMIRRLRNAAMNTPALDSSRDWTELITQADALLAKHPATSTVTT